MMGREHGFTIIEVMLFLGISALLFLVALTYMTGTIENVRFEDSVKTTESFLQRQFSAVQTNSVARPTWAGSSATCSAIGTKIVVGPNATNPDSIGNSASCILLGVELVFRSVGTASGRTIEAYPILGYAGASRDGGTIPALKAANPKILVIGSDGITQQPAETLVLPWGATMSRYKTVPGSNYNAVAILRSPASESINMVFHRVNATLENTDLATAAEDSAKTHRNIPAVLCIDRSGINSLSGAIIFDGKPGSTSISISSITSKILPSNEEVLAGTGLDCQ